MTHGPRAPDAPLLERVSVLLADRLGLDFPQSRWRDLARALAAAAPELGCADAHACAQQLLAAPLERAQLDVLAEHLTIGETYFFRDPAAFALLRTRILPERIAARRAAPAAVRRLRLWSAGCSTGEEPYSMAIVVEEMLRGGVDVPPVSLLATDVNPRALARARSGVYRDWSFRGPGRVVRERWCRPIGGGRHALDARIRERVRFAVLNLAEDVFPSLETQTNAIDVIFCRNVLMYLRPDQARAAVERLARCLAPGGWLVLSAVEAPSFASPLLAAQPLPDAPAFRKVEDGARAAVSPSSAWSPASPSSASSAVPQAYRALHGQRQRAAGAAVPFTPQSALDAARALYARGRYAAAAEVLRAVLDVEPEHGRALALMVRALANGGRLTEALAWSARAVAADRRDPARSFLHASVLLEQGRGDEAAAALRHCLSIDPHSPTAHFALGNLLASRGRRDEAQRHFSDALDALARMPEDQPLQDAEGLVAGRLAQAIRAMLDAAGEPAR